VDAVRFMKRRRKNPFNLAEIDPIILVVGGLGALWILSKIIDQVGNLPGQIASNTGSGIGTGINSALENIFGDQSFIGQGPYTSGSD
jgi:hypothetical protein